MVAASHASGARAKIADAEIVLIKQESEAVYACCGALAKPCRDAKFNRRRRILPSGEVFAAYLPNPAGTPNSIAGGEFCQAAKFLRRICQALRGCKIQSSGDEFFRVEKFLRRTCQALQGSQIQSPDGEFCRVVKFPRRICQALRRCQIQSPGDEFFRVEKFLRRICQNLRGCQIQSPSDEFFRVEKFLRRICQALRGCQIQSSGDEFCQVAKCPCRPCLRPTGTCVHATLRLKLCFFILISFFYAYKLLALSTP